MKIRTKGNSIRIRLSQTEVSAFARSGSVVDQTSFAPGQTLGYALRSSPQSRRITARLHEGCVTVYVPQASARAWADGEDVGLSATQPTGDGEILTILIEKDFQCLHGEGEPDPDAYPHPAESALRG